MPEGSFESSASATIPHGRDEHVQTVALYKDGVEVRRWKLPGPASIAASKPSSSGGDELRVANDKKMQPAKRDIGDLARDAALAAGYPAWIADLASQIARRAIKDGRTEEDALFIAAVAAKLLAQGYSLEIAEAAGCKAADLLAAGYSPGSAFAGALAYAEGLQAGLCKHCADSAALAAANAAQDAMSRDPAVAAAMEIGDLPMEVAEQALAAGRAAGRACMEGPKLAVAAAVKGAVPPPKQQLSAALSPPRKKVEKVGEEEAEARRKARKEAEDRVRRQAAERAKLAAAERARKEVEERARREKAERERMAAIEKAKKEAEERIRREADERARRLAQEEEKRLKAAARRKELDLQQIRRAAEAAVLAEQAAADKRAAREEAARARATAVLAPAQDAHAAAAGRAAARAIAAGRDEDSAAAAGHAAALQSYGGGAGGTPSELTVSAQEGEEIPSQMIEGVHEQAGAADFVPGQSPELDELRRQGYDVRLLGERDEELRKWSVPETEPDESMLVAQLDLALQFSKLGHPYDELKDAELNHEIHDEALPVSEVSEVRKVIIQEHILQERMRMSEPTSSSMMDCILM